MAMQAQRWTANALAVEFDISHRVTAKRLQAIQPCETKGRNKYYLMADAAPCLLQVDSPDDLDLTQERARLAKAQADKTELQLDVDKGKLIPAELVEEIWSNVITAVRARLLALPSKVSPMLALASEAEMESELQAQIYETLTEMSEIPEHEYKQTGVRPSGEGFKKTSTTTKIDSKRVGGSKKKPVK